MLLFFAPLMPAQYAPRDRRGGHHASADVFECIRDAAAGARPTGISTLLGELTSEVLFVALVAAGIVARRDYESHARWLLSGALWPYF